MDIIDGSARRFLVESEGYTTDDVCRGIKKMLSTQAERYKFFLENIESGHVFILYGDEKICEVSSWISELLGDDFRNYERWSRLCFGTGCLIYFSRADDVTAFKLRWV